MPEIASNLRDKDLCIFFMVNSVNYAHVCMYVYTQQEEWTEGLKVVVIYIRWFSYNTQYLGGANLEI